MKRQRRAPNRTSDTPQAPFGDAEEAWFWFIRCQKLRFEGASLSDAASAMARPCEPDDLYRAVLGLFRRKRIGHEHLRVLGTFGLRESPPDPRCGDEERASRLWDEALDRLATVLRAKGVLT